MSNDDIAALYIAAVKRSLGPFQAATLDAAIARNRAGFAALSLAIMGDPKCQFCSMIQVSVTHGHCFIIFMITLEYWLMLSIGTSNGANKPFVALVVLDPGNLLGEYDIEVATFNSAGNKKAHCRSATDNLVKQCREEKVERQRCVGLDKVLPLRKIIAWCIDLISMDWFRRQSPLLNFSCK